MIVRLVQKFLKKIVKTHERHALLTIIGSDLLRFGKLPLFLFICDIVIAMLVITTSYHTRLLIIQQERLALEREALDIEWRNLLLEEDLLINHRKYGKIPATRKLQLQSIDPLQKISQ